MVIIHPEYAYLILEVNELKDEIADLLVERDTLLFFVCKDLRIDYMLKIGSLEYKLIVAENNCKKNQRKLEIIKQKQKEKKKISLKSIQKQIDSEFEKNNFEENEWSDLVDLAIDASSVELFDYDKIEEMNIDYFKLHKMYNPVLNLKSSDETNKLYKKIRNYYQKQNYKKLHKLAENYDENDIFQDEISNLKFIREKYEEFSLEIKKQIRRIKNTFPYNQKTILEDENLYRRKKDNLNKIILEKNLENEKIIKKIDNILKKI